MRISKFSFVVVLAAVSILFSGCSREQRAKRAMKKADAFYAAGQLDRAEIEYLNVRKYDFRNRHAISRLATIRFDQGCTLSAYFALSAARTNDDSNIEVLSRFAQAAAMQRDVSNAVKTLDKVLSIQPDHAESVVLRAELARTQELAQMRGFLQQAEQKTGPRAAYAVAAASLQLRTQDITNAVRELNRAIQIDPKFSPAHLVLAQIHFVHGDTNRGVASLKTGSELAPLRSLRRLRYADYILATGAIQEGRKLVEDVTQRVPDYIPAWNLLAKIALSSSNYDGCEKALARVLGRDPSDFEGLTLKGRLYVAKEQLDRAATHWEEVTRMFTVTDSKAKQTIVLKPEAYLELARVQAQLRDTVKAYGTLNRLLSFLPQDSPEATDAAMLLAEIQLRSGDPVAAVKTMTQLNAGRTSLLGMLLLAEAYLAQNQLDAALRIARQIEEQSPRLPQAAYLAGTVLRGQEKLGESRKEFEKALMLAPGSIDATYQLVQLDIVEKKPQDALERVQHLIQRYPRSALPHVMAAQVYTSQARFDLAEKAFLEAIEVDPGFQGSYEPLVALYIQTGKHDQAIERLHSFLKSNPKGPSAAGTMFQLGMLYEAKKDTDKAKDFYEKTIELEPKATLALNNLAYLYADRYKQLDKASDLAKRAYDLVPTNAFTADTYGWILYQKGEYPQALRLVQQSAMVLTNNAEVRAHLGLVQYAVGDEEKAGVSFRTAMSLAKDFGGRAEVEEKLRVLSMDTNTGDPASIAALEAVLARQPSDAIALKRLTAIYAEKKDYAKLAGLYESSFKANPRNLTTAWRLTQLYALSLNNPDKALEVIRSGKGGATTDPTLALSMGKMALQLGAPKDSLLYLEEAAQKTAGNAEAYFLLGSAQYQLKDNLAAKKALTEAVKLKLDGDALQKANQMLKELK